MSDIKNDIEGLMKNAAEITSSVFDCETHQPFICTHPTFYHEGHFYILSTKIAKQTKYYEAGSELSVIVVGECTVKQNLFSRKRVTILCKPKELEKDDKLRGLFEKHLGTFASGLMDVTDFKVFLLKPIGGLYFRGFGRAFEFTSDSVDVIHLKEPHKPKSGNTMAKILKNSLSKV
ncbi:hypothetical protein [Shewanella sp. YLB-07]|uniref:hypothetical protein n=1 Tax=Shewanella sp. YLB-07 TaxID=2601268 RepID=UPI001883D272|nr:hypothetical protein [Shewanella sp. YLB-07]